MLPVNNSDLLQVLLILIIVAFVGYILQYVIRKVMYSYSQRKKAAISLLARYRNRATIALWDDMMDIKLAGIVPVGTKVEGWLNVMFPREMAELEWQRTKNPIAWRSTMEFLMPLIVSLKSFATYKGQEVLQGIIGNVVGGITNAAGNPEQNIKDPPLEDQSSLGDPVQGETGVGEL